MATRAPDTLDNHLAWLKQAACLGEDTEVFFSDSLPNVRIAKWYCNRCPVRQQCLNLAMTAEDTHRFGTFGGLTWRERQGLAKGKQPKPERTPEYIVDDYTQEIVPGHFCWVGPVTVSYRNRSYSPRQIAFLAARGRPAEGRVTTTCEVGTCMVHIADERERTRCGTRGGYTRHLREGTEACQPCRDANNEADRRLHATGTTKGTS